MNYEKYSNVIANSNFSQYEFTSIGPKGEIKKCIHFIETSNAQIFNLAFGNLLEDGNIDDLAIDNNLDRNKILATVVSIIYEFSTHYPTKWIFFCGSTIERTRLYRMAITTNFEELSNDFEILGVIDDNILGYINMPFQKGINYFGFLIKQKNT
jgi:hypothetical protein